MKNDKRVSVLMGVYNCEKTVAESIESIINQTYKDWELIICDDASTDNTYDIVTSYKDKYPERIILLKNDRNRKLAYSLNRCLKSASGEYIARMDGDDISLPERFEKQITFLEAHPEFALVGTAMIPFDEKGERFPRTGKKEPKKNDLIFGACFNHATIIMKKNALKNLQGYTVSPRTFRGQDYDLWIKFFAAGYRGYNIQEPLYKVRETIQNTQKKSLMRMVYSIQTTLIALRKLNYPLKYYLFILKPVIAFFIPSKILFKYHNSKLRREIKGVTSKESG